MITRSSHLLSRVVKRTFDVTAGGISLLLLMPLMAAIAVAVKLSSSGPIFFRQIRVGRGFQPFPILKFRTMWLGVDGPPITVGGDLRVTRVGRFLRATKLDELPQLFNVLRGDMSLVGPRPEIPRYVELFRADYAEILTVRPGITDFASFQYRNEEQLLAQSADPECEYTNVILPVKVELGKRYVRRASLGFDAGIIVKTVLELLWHHTSTLRHLILHVRRPLVVVLHVSLAVGSYYVAWWFRFDGLVPAHEQALAVRLLPLVLVVRGVTLYYFRLYEGLWRFTDIWDVERIFVGVLASQAIVVGIVRFGLGFYEFPRAVFMLDAMLFMFSMIAARLVWRAYIGLGAFEPNLRTLIVGPHRAAALLAHALRDSDSDRLVVGLVDTNRERVGLHIHGVPVIASVFELSEALHRVAPDEILVVGAVDADARHAIDDAASDYGVSVRQAPDLMEMLADPSIRQNPARLDIAPSLARVTVPVPDAVEAKPHRQQCPMCGALAARRTRAVTLWERSRRFWSSKSFYRCEVCRRRFWLEPVVPIAPLAAEASVDFDALDAALRSSPDTHERKR